MPTITHEQIKTLLGITKSLAAKYRLDKPADCMKELELLTGLIKELRAGPQYGAAPPESPPF